MIQLCSQLRNALVPHAQLKHFGFLFIPWFYKTVHFGKYKLIFKNLEIDVQVGTMLCMNFNHLGVVKKAYQIVKNGYQMLKSSGRQISGSKWSCLRMPKLYLYTHRISQCIPYAIACGMPPTMA